MGGGGRLACEPVLACRWATRVGEGVNPTVFPVGITQSISSSNPTTVDNIWVYWGFSLWISKNYTVVKTEVFLCPISDHYNCLGNPYKYRLVYYKMLTVTWVHLLVLELCREGVVHLPRAKTHTRYHVSTARSCRTRDRLYCSVWTLITYKYRGYWFLRGDKTHMRIDFILTMILSYSSIIT